MNRSAALPQALPAVVVHGLDQALAALAPGLPVCLLSAPGAALGAGCQWWRAVVDAARATHPQTDATDILDCADAPGLAMAALRIGQIRLILWPSCPAFAAVQAAAASLGAIVLPTRPDALDLARRGSTAKLITYLRNESLS